MNEKTFILSALFAIGLYAPQGLAVNKEPISINYHYADNLPEGYTKIDLKGQLDVSVGPNAVVAGANENSVYIGFNQDFGTVNINIYNGAGLVVYNTVVNTSVQQVVIIPITSAASGTYTVELSNANGYADGDFELN